MTTLSIQIPGLLPAQVRALDKKARHLGKTAPEYVRGLIERDLLLDRPFDEILAPIRAEFRKSGISEDELDLMVDRARGAAQRKRRGALR